MSDQVTAGPNGAARVLVVDDSLVIRKAIEKKLKAEFDLVMANDGEAGWDALLGDDQVRVLITDIEMPRLDGYSFICRIRASEDPRLRDLPIIAITGAEDEETKERAFACGATDFVVKPIDPMQLLARVHALTKLNRATRQLAESQAALKDQATLDPLTQLCSRRYFQQSCQQVLAYAVRHGQDLALIRIEIDEFKHIYQQHGDDRVDELLVWLADIFSATCRREDTLSRTGGAEFAVVAPATNPQKTQALCRRLCDAVRAKPFVSGTTEIPVTLSVGAVTLRENALRSYEELMGIVERRTRRARIAGGNRVVAAEEVGPEAAEELSLAGLEAAPASVAVPDEPIPALPEVMEMPGEPIPALLEVMELSALELDILEYGEDAAPIDMAALPPLSDQTGAADSLEFVGLDAALQRLANGEGDSIEPWLDHIARRLLPLLEFYSDRRDGALAAVIADIKTRCQDRG